MKAMFGAGIGIFLALASAPSIGQTPNCNDLVIINNNHSWWVMNKISCTAGIPHELKNWSAYKGLKNVPNGYGIYGSDAHGPHCDFKMTPGTSNNSGISDITLTISQNYCLLKAGDINVTSSGQQKPILSFICGSYADDRFGTVTIQSFEWADPNHGVKASISQIHDC